MFSDKFYEYEVLLILSLIRLIQLHGLIVFHNTTTLKAL